MLRLRRWFSDPLILLAVIAAFAAVAVQSGEPGTSDTVHRIQAAHSFWTGQPQVFPNEYPEFGLHGRHGRLYPWYGIGQSLLVLPIDILGTAVETALQRLPSVAAYEGNDPTIRNIVLTTATNTLLAVLTAVVCFRFLRRLQFTQSESAAGTLALLFCTTHLHYTQNMMENDYIFLLTLTGFSHIYAWLQTGSRRALAIGSAAFGLNLLTRLTTALDLFAAAVFVLLICSLERGQSSIAPRLKLYLRTALPIYAAFFLIDRLYQFYRFGSFTNTYMTVFAHEERYLDPSLPANFPWNGRWLTGLTGPILSLHKSIFLFDPLLILSLLLTLLLWRRLAPVLRAFFLTTTLLLAAYIVFYAKFIWWPGDFAWGDRYVSSAAELAALMAVPIFLRHRNELGRGVRVLAVSVITASLLIQLASLAFWLPLEIYQSNSFEHPTFVIALRFKNIAAFALGKMALWGLDMPALHADPWDYTHLTTWNFLPFVLKRGGAAPPWMVRTAFVLWAVALAGLGAALLRLQAVLANNGRNRGIRPRSQRPVSQ